MIEVGVRDNDNRVALEQVRKVFAKAGYTQPGIDDQIAVTSTQMPDVGAQEKVHVWLDDDVQPVPDLRGDEPAISYGHDRVDRRSSAHLSLPDLQVLSVPGSCSRNEAVSRGLRAGDISSLC